LPRSSTPCITVWHPKIHAQSRICGQPSPASQHAFAGLGVDPQRVREVAALIPGAMRGLVSERQLGSYADLDEARRGLTNALATYLEQSRPR
jgi:hypothetical protein